MNQNGKRVHAATQHPYWSDSSDSDDDDDLRVLDLRIYQGGTKSNYLTPKQEVKAQNGYVWCSQDKRRAKNKMKCSYPVPVPSRGNCPMCGRSGPLGHPCSNYCVMTEVSVSGLIDAALDRKELRSSEYEDDPDLDIKQGDRSKYRIMLTPKNERKLDAYMFSEMNYNEVSKGAANYDWFKSQTC